MSSKLSTTTINLAYIILQTALIAAFFAKKEYLSIFESVFAFTMYLLLIFYESRKGMLITSFIRAAVLFTILSNSFLGEYLDLFNKPYNLDKLYHIFGTFSFTIFIYTILEIKAGLQNLKKSFKFVFILLLGTFLGTIYEILEFLSDYFFETANQNGLVDTDVDMICDILGAVVAGIYAVRGKHIYKHQLLI